MSLKCGRVHKFVNFVALTSIVMLHMFSSSVRSVTCMDTKSCDSQCPPKDLGTKSTLDLTSFITDRWYAVKQKPVTFQPEETFFCVYAEYTLVEKSKPWYCRFASKAKKCKGLTVQVYNYGNDDKVNGNITDVRLVAKVPDPVNAPAKLKVGPKFLPDFLKGSYWVLEAGSYDELLNNKTVFTSTDYEWAIISGGALNGENYDDGEYKGKCSPKAKSDGLWMFSRQAIPPLGVMEKIDALAKSKGIDTSVWKEVKHKGCNYAPYKCTK